MVSDSSIDASTWRCTAFTGREWDPETGLYYYRARYYDPKIGRFLSEDAAGVVASPSLYTYVSGNPIRRVDPLGLLDEDHPLVTPKPGFWASLIPVYGPVMEARHAFDTEHWGWGSFHTAAAVSDAFLLNSVAKGLTTGVCKGGSHSWNATRKWLGKTGYAEKGQPVHHWFLAQAEGLGKYMPDWIKNQPWNLMTLPDQAAHIAVHGQGKYAMNVLEQLWYGTPQWFKAFVISGGTRGAEASHP